MHKIRLDHELSLATERWGWKYHHIGIPTSEVKSGEEYLSRFGLYVSGFSTSPFGIEWMRFEESSSIHPLIKKVPHICFEVQDIEYELSRHNFNVISAPNPTSDNNNIRAAMIEHNGAPIELIEFRIKG
ncbi:MAG: hypothetical protein E6767_18620 [Dysgonomonas sp.]|nr:hypothetical protein [Dysgonomonas sp.]